jgi:hypothetical protein
LRISSKEEDEPLKSGKEDKVKKEREETKEPRKKPYSRPKLKKFGIMEEHTGFRPPS